MDTRDLSWSKVATLTDDIGSLPVSWAGFGQAWEVHRQVYVQHLCLPETDEDWHAPIWIALNEELVAFGKKLLSCLDRPEHRDNLLACIECAESDLRYLLFPMSDEEAERIRQALGFDDMDSEEEDEEPEEDWWRL